MTDARQTRLISPSGRTSRRPQRLDQFMPICQNCQLGFDEVPWTCPRCGQNPGRPRLEYGEFALGFGRIVSLIGCLICLPCGITGIFLNFADYGGFWIGTAWVAGAVISFLYSSAMYFVFDRAMRRSNQPGD